MSGEFSNEYCFKKERMVVIKHRKGQFLRISPHNNVFLDENGGIGKFARWNVEFDGNQDGLKVIKLRHNLTSKYLRIQYGNINVGGQGGQFCRFKVHPTNNHNSAKLESCAYSRKFPAVQPKGCTIGGGGKWTEFYFFRQDIVQSKPIIYKEVNIQKKQVNIDEVTEFLKYFKLSKYNDGLKESGVEQLSDLNDLGDDDITDLCAEISMPGLHKKKFINACKQVQAGNYPPKKVAIDEIGQFLDYYKLTKYYASLKENGLSSLSEILELNNSDIVGLAVEANLGVLHRKKFITACTEYKNGKYPLINANQQIIIKQNKAVPPKQKQPEATVNIGFSGFGGFGSTFKKAKKSAKKQYNNAMNFNVNGNGMNIQMNVPVDQHHHQNPQQAVIYAVQPTTTVQEMDSTEKCIKCKGKGVVGYYSDTCKLCSGDGFVKITKKIIQTTNMFGQPQITQMSSKIAAPPQCSMCKGKGFIHDTDMDHDAASGKKCFFCDTCETCGGNGVGH